MEPGSLGRELQQDGDRAVRLRAGHGEEAVSDFALHHHAPRADAGQPVEALDDDRRRDVVRQIRDELSGCRVERGEVECERVAPVEVGARHVAEARLEAAVDLDRVNVCDALGQEPCQHAESGADLEHDVGGLELGEPLDHTQDVLVNEEVLAELLLRDDRHSANAASALASMRAASSAASSPRACASAETVWTTCAGSLRRPRTGCGAR